MNHMMFLKIYNEINFDFSKTIRTSFPLVLNHKLIKFGAEFVDF